MALAASVAAFALADAGAAFASVPEPVDDPAVATATADVELEISSPIIEIGSGDLVGIYADADDGDAEVENLTDVVVYSYDGLADGIFAAGDGVAVDNQGQIAAYAETWGAGIEAQGESASTVANSGSIYAYGRDGFGIYATAEYGDVAVANSGSIEAQGYYATGILSRGQDHVTVSNAGDISSGSVHVSKGYYGGAMLATGIQAGSNQAGGLVEVANSGRIEATSAYASVGIDAYATGAGGIATVSNEGSIHASQAAHDSPYQTVGIIASGDMDSNIRNTGSVEIESGGTAYGTMALAFSGNASVVNAGDIAVHSHDALYFNPAAGIVAYSANGVASVDNHGQIDAVAFYDVQKTTPTSVFAARGVYAIGMDGVDVRNSGDISAEGFTARGVLAYSGTGDISIANTDDGAIEVRSYLGRAAGIAATAFHGDVDVVNDGVVDVYGNTWAAGINALGYGDVNVHVVNTGTIHTTARSGSASSQAAFALEGHVLMENHGSIVTRVQGLAYGALANGDYVTVVNHGDIDVESLQSHTITARGWYDANVVLGSDSTVQSRSSFGGFGVEAMSAIGVANVTNAGSIDMTSTYDNGIGIRADGGSGAIVDNSGEVRVSVTEGRAMGIWAYAAGDVEVTNTGTIAAVESIMAVGVGMDARNGGTATLVNSGTIMAEAPGMSAVAIQGGSGVDRILNSGEIIGAILTNAGDDLFHNAEGGVWEVDNFMTSLGAGNDTIVNAGTIHLANGLVAMGEGANAFDNRATLQAQGHSIIAPGAGSALSNSGTISMADGHAGDTLSIFGDLAGNGRVGVDLDLANGVADSLSVEGSLADGTVQAIDVRVIGMPAAVDGAAATIIEVTGRAGADAFVAGNILGFDRGNFLDLGMDIDMSATDASSRFSASITVDGLNDTGLLVASVAPGAQRLVDSIVGTRQQRMGVQADLQHSSGIGPWFRYFTRDGDVDPHSTGLGAGSDARFEQENRGHEFGVQLPLGETGVSVGVMVGEATGEQRLSTANGATRFEADFSGVYASWVAPRFYLDASVRRIDIEARLESPAGEQRTRADSTAFDIEYGFTGWSPAALRLVPQIQYTRATIDDLAPVRGADVDFTADGGTSERVRAGLGISHVFAMANGALLTPYGTVSAVYEMDGKSDYMVDGNALFSGAAEVDGTSALLEAGLGLQVHGLTVSGSVDWMDGGAIDSTVGGQITVRYAW